MQHAGDPIQSLVIDEKTGHFEVTFEEFVSNRQLKRIRRHLAAARFVSTATRFKHIVKAHLKTTSDKIVDEIIDLIVSAINCSKRMSQELLPDARINIAVATVAGDFSGPNPSEKPSYRKMRFSKRTTRSQQIVARYHIERRQLARAR